MSSQECPATKVCKDCSKRKPLSAFYKTKRENGAVRYLAVCKPCFGLRSAASYQKRRVANLKRSKEYRKENAERITKYLRKWYKKNREKIIARSKAYQSRPERRKADKARLADSYQERREEIRARQNAQNATPEGRRRQRVRYLKHYSANPSYYTAKATVRRNREIRARLPWVRYVDLQPWYEMASAITKRTGVKHVVDHIVPLVNGNVCGLHVPWNLRVIPELENLRKFNKLG